MLNLLIFLIMLMVGLVCWGIAMNDNKPEDHPNLFIFAFFELPLTSLFAVLFAYYSTVYKKQAQATWIGFWQWFFPVRLLHEWYFYVGLILCISTIIWVLIDANKKNNKSLVE